MNTTEIKMPKGCGKCAFIGAYIDGPFKRNPHYCCELMWQLFKTDYRVSPETIDDKCPLLAVKENRLKITDDGSVEGFDEVK